MRKFVTDETQARRRAWERGGDEKKGLEFNEISSDFFECPQVFSADDTHVLAGFEDSIAKKVFECSLICSIEREQSSRLEVRREHATFKGAAAVGEEDSKMNIDPRFSHN